MKKLLPLIFAFILFVSKSYSQTIPVGDYMESLARMYQVLGISNDISSFTQRPINSNSILKTDSIFQNLVAGKNIVPNFKLFGIPSSVKILPLTWLNEYNTKFPYGYNNGPLFPNAGYQTLLSGGVFIKAGIFNIQLKPEFVYAENKPFPTLGTVNANKQTNVVGEYWYFFNAIDAPERFGPNSNRYAGLGQSKVTINLFNMEVGLSTENIWWGPGVQNSILMSNSAPGFLHWTFNTVAPVKTTVGSFEWQIIGGELKQSGFEQYEASTLPNSSVDYKPKPKVNRYISGFTFNWHPKWVNGLFLGVSGYDYMDIDSSFHKKGLIKRVFPVFFPISNQENLLADANKQGGQDYAYAINIRQLFSKDKAEIYFEYARNDNFASIRDLILEPEQATAYTIGTSKFFPLKESDRFIKVTIELTHLQLPDNFLLRPEPSWYVHQELNPLDGYTNEGRYVGAGIGSGSNSLMFDISYIRNINSFGIKMERFVHNNDLYYNAFAGTGIFNSEWIDFSSTFYAKIKLKRYLVSAEYTPVYMYNYEYLNNNNLNNTHARVSLTYFFN